MYKIYLFIFLLFTCASLTAQTNNDAVDTTKVGKRVFKLGEVVINGKKDHGSSVISSEQVEVFNRLDVSHALNLLPGVSLASVGARNESVVFIRGFDLRQVPVFIDGIPVYVPYDGYVDLARFTTFDIAQINVEKGFSSVTYGANTLGGVINLISRRPLNKFEIDARAGLLSGDGHRLNVNAGTRLGKFYLQGSASQLKQKWFPLSKDFLPKANEEHDRRDNSFREDNKYTVKLGFTPTATDEYAISYVKQQGEKGNPPYVGNDELQRARFWQWPYWDKESLYFISNTAINENSFIKTRFFYDRFKNRLDAFDDNTYTTQNRPSSFQSFYKDDTYGTSLEYDNRLSKQHYLKASAQFKNDRHKENNLGEPERTFKDYTASLGVEDAYRLNEKLVLMPGVSLNLRNSLEAQNYDSSTGEITDLPANKNYALNAQIGAIYQLNTWSKFNVSVARKSRFATIKDRYSYRMGAAIPNPDLKAERAMHYEMGYSARYTTNLQLEASAFYSRITDVIQQVNNVLPNTYQLQNTGKAAFYGGELALNYAILKDWQAGAQYSYIHRSNLSDENLKFIDVPNHKVMIFSSYEYKKIASLMVNWEYNASRYSTSYGVKAGAFAIAGLSARVKVYQGIAVESGINNVFDKNYAVSEGFPEPGRNYFINLVFNNL